MSRQRHDSTKQTIAFVVILVSAAIATGQSDKQQVVIEYGPAPEYRTLGLHRLVANANGCQIQRYAGTIVSIAESFFEALGPASFTLRTREGRKVSLGFEQGFTSRGVTSKQIVSFLRKGRRVNVRAYQCGTGMGSMVDSIELSQ